MLGIVRNRLRVRVHGMRAQWVTRAQTGREHTGHHRAIVNGTVLDDRHP